MEVNAGGITDINQLFSEDGIIRNGDKIVNDLNAFVGGQVRTAVAATHAAIQLVNPTASGVALFIDGIELSTDISGLVRISSRGTPLANLLGGWFNNKIGAANGLGMIYNESLGALTGTTYTTRNMLANQPYFIRFPFPLLIPENAGLVTQCDTQNTNLTCIFHGREFTT